MAVNKVILLGNLGKDPELRYTPSQTAVCRFSLATSDRRKDSSGQWTDHTEWHNIVTFGKTAENCSNYLKKGRQVFIEGRIQTNKWQDKEGRDRYTTEIIANTVQFVGNRPNASNVSVETVPDQRAAAFEGLQPADAIAAASGGGGDDVAFDDDDIPF